MVCTWTTWQFAISCYPQ